MRILAVIPARGGSKRLPRKNIRSLGGRPLIAWSIAVTQNIAEIVDVLVSTDDEEIAGIALAHGALVPWLRPSELASDEATSADVCIHALNWYEAKFGSVDGLLLLQPTSPFRGRETIVNGLMRYEAIGFRPVVAFSPAVSHPMWCVRIEGETVVPFLGTGGFDLRSQDLPPAYAVNGALYLISPEVLRKTRGFLVNDVTPLLMERAETSIDIDTELDWWVAEAVLRSGLLSA
jgi:CMP-N,N'-diacetyllegionaminic acid synthase